MTKRSFVTSSDKISKYSSSGGLLWTSPLTNGGEVAVYSSDIIYVIDNNGVYKLTSSGNKTTFDSFNTGKKDIKVDTTGNLYYTSSDNTQLQKVTSTGGVEWTLNQSGAYGIIFAIDDQDYVYSGSSLEGIVKFNSSGSSIAKWDNFTLYPTGIGVTPSSDGKLYIADGGTCHIVNTSDMSSGGSFNPFVQNSGTIRPCDTGEIFIGSPFGGVGKFTSTGGIVWRNTAMDVEGVSIDKDLNVFISETNSSEKYVTLNSSGSLVWKSTESVSFNQNMTEDGLYDTGFWASGSTGTSALISALEGNTVAKGIIPVINNSASSLASISAITANTQNKAIKPNITTSNPSNYPTNHQDHYGYPDGTNLWISSQKLNFIVVDRWYSLVGTNQGVSTQPEGSLYLDGEELGYVDELGNYRTISFVDATGLTGHPKSLWLQANDYIRFTKLNGQVKKLIHSDYVDTHNDHSDRTSHSDTEYSNATHADSLDHDDHTDHQDWDNNISHEDSSHMDWDDALHTNWDDSSSYIDFPYEDWDDYPHTDHTNNITYENSVYQDWDDYPHTDHTNNITYENSVYQDWDDALHTNWDDSNTHSDLRHLDHDDHNDAPHDDTHNDWGDFPYGHGDGYNDDPHSNYTDHDDRSYRDTPAYTNHVNWDDADHTNVPHFDTSSYANHVNWDDYSHADDHVDEAPYTNHVNWDDADHTNVPHFDTSSYANHNNNSGDHVDVWFYGNHPHADHTDTSYRSHGNYSDLSSHLDLPKLESILSLYTNTV